MATPPTPSKVPPALELSSVLFRLKHPSKPCDTEYTLESPVPGSQEHATRVVIRRVDIAEAALETLMTLPREMLNRLRIKASSHGGGEEGFCDVINSGVQKTGPAVLYIAKKAVHTVILVIVVELSERFKGAVGAESSATPCN
ncbi:hypothetical protein N0V92_006574 [Colletotrichum tropicale]|nr:hypothetical protein N0V92_006574 [Colletotrichum tropicale]